MQRLHVSLKVNDLEHSTEFYSKLFNAEPTMQKDDYTQWILDDPRVNFSVVLSNSQPGLGHLGIQAETDAELSSLYERLEQTNRDILKEGDTICCYAKSNKNWITDPANIAWEAFKTEGRTEGFSSDRIKQASNDCGEACNC